MVRKMSNIWLVDISNSQFEDVDMRKKHPKNYIKELREARELTLEDLAAKVHVTNPYISMLELGKRGLSWNMVKKIADALDCSPLEVTEGPLEGVVPKNEQEKELLKRFRGFSSGEQKMFSHMLDTFSKEKPHSPRKDNDGHDVSTPAKDGKKA